MSTILFIIAIYIFLITAVQIGLIIKGYRDSRGEVTEYDWNPSVSIIMPCYNEEKSILKSVTAAVRQTYDNFNVIVVDDGSEDTSAELLINRFNLQKMNKEGTIWENGILTLLQKENGGKHSALNMGIAHSTSDRVLAVDADSLLVPHALETVVKRTNPEATASTTGIGMVNGCEVDDDGALASYCTSFNPLIASQTIEYMRTFLMLKLSLNKNNAIMVLSGACSFFDREFIQRIGGYKERLTEDAEITLRIHANDGTVQFIPDVLSYTECPSGLKMLSRQRYRWIRGIIRDSWEHRSLMRRKTVLGRFMIPYFYITDLVFPWLELIGWVLFIYTLFFGNIMSMSVFILFLTYVIGMYILNNRVLLWVANRRLIPFKQIKNGWYLQFISTVDYIYYRPIMVYFVITSQFKEFFRTASPWGKQSRRGL